MEEVLLGTPRKYYNNVGSSREKVYLVILLSSRVVRATNIRTCATVKCIQHVYYGTWSDLVASFQNKKKKLEFISGFRHILTMFL